jgi:penicillin-binding protein 1C
VSAGPRAARRLRAGLGGVGLAAGLLLVGWALAWGVPLPARLASDGSTVVQWRDGTTAHVFLAPDDRWRIPVRVDEVDPALLEALIRLEDKRFARHLGVDGLAILRAAFLNASQGEVVSGGSTLTMQVVRLLQPRPRTVASKLVEAARAVQLELRLSKAEILEAWLQFTPYGRNVEGIEAASWSYFGHGANALSPAEIATLLAVPQNPNARYPRPDHEDRLRAVRDDIAARLLDAGALTLGVDGAPRASAADVLAEVRGEAAPRALRPMPRSAPHAAVWLADRNPGEARIDSTLVRGAQRVVDDTLARAAGELARVGVADATVVVLDRRTREVIALGGNLPGRFIAAFDVPRSPGSALKPFVQVLAIDRGLALPGFLVPDVPATWGSWSPTNYDGGFDGLVRLDDALSRSLNLPFVGLLQELGVEEFLGALRGMGVRSLVADPGHYGLSVAVGGLELTPLELAGLYATLAEGGRWVPPRLRRSEPEVAPIPALGEGATWLTRQVLARRDRPDFPRRRELQASPAHIHWKTGTSSGRRDAWAVGSGPEHTVAVWVGNLDNTGSAQLVGSEAAGPLLFDVLEALRDRRRPPPVDPIPSELREIPVCAYSGHPVGAACPRATRALARLESVPTTTCPFHVDREVEVDTGLAVRPECRRQGVRTERRTFVLWPATVRRFVQARHRHLPEPPTWAEGCAPLQRDRAPSILSPPADHVALLIPGMPIDKQQMPLEAEASGDAQLSWFVDGVFLGTVPATERMWWTPAVGVHEIVVTDERGRVGKRELEVRGAERM